MDNQLQHFKFSLSLNEQKNFLDTLRKAFKSQIWNSVIQFYKRTRSYEDGLYLAENLQNFIEANKEQITDKEFEEWDRSFIFLKLHMLDCLNKWREYLEYFAFIRKERSYCLTYSKSRNDEDIQPFILYDSDYYRHVHFLFTVSHRQKIIKRKYDKWRKGQPVEHLKRHQQDRLSDEEIKRRMGFIVHILAGGHPLDYHE